MSDKKFILNADDFGMSEALTEPYWKDTLPVF